MSRPDDAGSFAERLYEQLAPLAKHDEESTLWHLLSYCGGAGQMFQDVEDLIRDTDAGIGWSSVLDVDRAPDYGLGWLAQMVGVTLTPKQATRLASGIIYHERDVGETNVDPYGWDATGESNGPFPTVPYGIVRQDLSISKTGVGLTKCTLVGDSGSANFARGFLSGVSGVGGTADLGLASRWGQGASVVVSGYFYLYPGFYANSGTRETQIFRLGNTDQGAPGTQLGIVIYSSGGDPNRKLRLVLNMPNDALAEELVIASGDFGSGTNGKLAEGRIYRLTMKFKFHATNGLAYSEFLVDTASQGSSNNRNLRDASRIHDRVRGGVVDGAASATGYSIGVDGPVLITSELPWLTETSGETDEEYIARMRERIRATGGFRRGTREALIAAAQQHLTGTKYVLLNERNGSAWRLGVITKAEETPDSTLVQNALLSQKPGGIILSYLNISGSSYAAVRTAFNTYTLAHADYTTYQAMRDNPPTP